MRVSAKKMPWEVVSLKGIEVLFCDVRIERQSVPEGYYMYEVRHEDEDWGTPCELKCGILVNFFGTVLSKEMLLDAKHLYMDIDGYNDFVYLERIVKL